MNVIGASSRSWDVVQIPLAGVLERESLFILREFQNVVMCGQLRMHPQSEGGPRSQLTRNGTWQLFELMSHGEVNETNALLAPHTTRVLHSDEATNAGLCYFSVLGAHSHVAPHCGPTTRRLRLHLGLSVPHGARMRVGGDIYRWENGRVLVFDDSLEHEVWNEADCPRGILLADVWRPARKAADRNHDHTNDAREKRNAQRSGWGTCGEVDLRNSLGHAHRQRIALSLSHALCNDNVANRVRDYWNTGNAKCDVSDVEFGCAIWQVVKTLLRHDSEWDLVVDLIHAAYASRCAQNRRLYLTEHRRVVEITRTLSSLSSAQAMASWCCGRASTIAFELLAPLFVTSLNTLRRRLESRVS
jgi:hypothetical protein